MSFESLAHHFAVRLAVTCRAMGLDDEDEMLLWRFVAQLPEGQELPEEVRSVLLDQAVYSPTLIQHCVWDANYPQRFYKPKRKLLSKLGWGLEMAGHSNDLNIVVMDSIEAIRNMEAGIREDCFAQWMDEITACLRPDGVNWEPPGDADVQLRLRVVSINLRERLAI